MNITKVTELFHTERKGNFYETTIWGNILPAVTIDLEQGESIYTESGGMTWMSDKVKMDTNMKGGFMKGLGRMFSGESLFYGYIHRRGTEPIYHNRLIFSRRNQRTSHFFRQRIYLSKISFFCVPSKVLNFQHI